MEIEFLANVKLSLFMKDYIEESIDFFGEDLIVRVSSPAKKGFKNIHESSTRLENKDAEILNSIVAKLLWLPKGGRPKIDPVVSYL